ncbi:MFS transporter [Sulfitobacter sp. DFL-23]|jgi:MFS family permease|uniref:Putative MFS-type transporter YcaD n=2 Tax=Pseudosulfitobacter pseudonitzschiae TaxID=1402135 RepID=A0A221JWM4_9RHOB|nr:putative MFS-type transporter YcaD [Pseudosulfitobacter pseudonitzschiae]
MINSIKGNWALFAGMLMLMAANGLLVTLLSVRGAAVGMSASSIGLMQSGYPLGALAGCVYAPRLIARIGHVRAFAALGSLCSITAIVHLLSVDVWTWGAMRILAGFCFPGLYVISESWLNARTANTSRATVLSVYFVVQMAGASAGQALAGAGEDSGALMFGVASILISLSFLPVLMSHNPAPEYVPPVRMSLRELVSITSMGVLGAMLNGAAQATVYIGLPLYGLARGMAASEATLLVVAATLAGAVAQFPVGLVSDRWDRRFIVAALAVACTLTSIALAMGLFGDAVLVAAILLGATVLPVYSVCVAYANDHLVPAQIVPASGSLVLSLNVGILVGAFVGPASLEVMGTVGVPVFLATLGALTTTVAIVRVLSSAPPEDNGVAHPISAQGVQTVGALHPEADAQ